MWIVEFPSRDFDYAVASFAFLKRGIYRCRDPKRDQTESR